MHWIIILFIAGIVFICAEVFLPGAICGVIGTLCLISAVFMCYSFKGIEIGTYFLAGSIILTGLAIFIASGLLAKTKTGKSPTLESSETNYTARGKDLSHLFNKTGITISFLRPSGIADFGGERVDVVSDGEFIDRGAKIKIVMIEGSNVVVKKV